MRIGHARVSTKEQNLELQLFALQKAGCKKIFQEKTSGRAQRTPALEAALAVLKRGDTLVFWHIDRLGRNARSLINLEYELKLRGVALVSLTQNIDTSTPKGELEFLESCVKAQGESVRISERTKAGMEVARSKGNYPGPRKCLNAKQVTVARFLALTERQSLAAIAKKLRCGKSTVWRALQPDYLSDK